MNRREERERERGGKKERRKGVRRLTFRGNPPQTLEFALLGLRAEEEEKVEQESVPIRV